MRRMMEPHQQHLDIAVRVVLGTHAVGVIQFMSYRNFVLQADKAVRPMFRGQSPARGPRRNQGQSPSRVDLVPLAARQHACRALVEKYVKLGLVREVLLSLLSNVLSIGLEEQSDKAGSR